MQEETGLFRPVLELPDVPDAILTSDTRELKYWNPEMTILVGAVSAEGLLAVCDIRKSTEIQKTSWDFQFIVICPVSIFFLLFIVSYKNQTGRTIGETLDKFLPFVLMYEYWLEPNKITNFTELLKNYYFKNPHNITMADLRTINDVSRWSNFL